MIYPITDIFSIHTVTIEEKNHDFTEFMDKLFEVLQKYELGVFKTPDKRLFKAVLIKRTDVHERIKVVERTYRGETSWIASRRVQVILKYEFKELA